MIGAATTSGAVIGAAADDPGASAASAAEVAASVAEVAAGSQLNTLAERRIHHQA